MNKLITFLVVIKSISSILIRVSHAKFVEGHLIVAEKWHFVARFCFLSEHGQFEYYIDYSKEYAVQNLLLYYDTDNQWPSVYKTKKTCEEKESVLNINQNQIINLTENDYTSGCILLKNSNSSSSHSKHANISCHNARRFHSARPRWWFLAISHCNATNGLNLRFKFIMTNGSPGELWKEHFSADEFYILPVLFSFFVMYIVILLATIACSIELKSRQLLHSTYKLFTLSVISQEIGITLLCIAYIRYAIDGVGYPRLKNLGRIFESSSEILFLLLLLLLAKGYTITRGRLRLASSVKLTIFMCAYVVTTLGLFIFEEHVFDPGEVLYLYESPPGYGLMILRVAAWWIFEYSTVFTLKHYPEKSNFYYPFNLMGTLWFVAGPCFTLIANSLIDKWIRESVVYGICHLIAIIGHILFLFLTVPNKANKNFPYHVRTSQIGVMEMTGVSGNNSLYNFGPHPYAPYVPPISVIDADTSRICSPTVPVDLFSIHPSSTVVCKSTTTTATENVNSFVDATPCKKDQNGSNLSNSVTGEETEPTRTPKMDQMNHFSSTAPCSATDRIFTVDRFIAPALRSDTNNRTLSA